MHFETREEKILELYQQNLDELLTNELNHEEPPWRTLVNKRMTRYNEGWKNKIKACDDFEGGSDKMTEEIWTPEKKRWKHLELEFIHQEQTLMEGIKHLEEIRIRFIVYLPFINLDWWQAMDLAYYLFVLKRIEKWHIADLRRSSWTTGRIERTTVKNSKMTD